MPGRLTPIGSTAERGRSPTVCVVASLPLAPGSVSLRLYPADLDPVDCISTLRAQARLADEVGFDGVMVSEHHGDFPGYLPNPVQLAGLLLSEMSSGWAAPCPLLLPLRQWALTAEDIAWLGAAFPGRVGVGFAAGALPVDFEIAEVPFDERVDRFKAQLPLIVSALRGESSSPLGDDRALAACAASPIPMAVAAQSTAAVRRAARYGLAVLYDSLQTDDVTRRLTGAYEDAGGTAAKILIRRVWIGDPPTEQMADQMAHYRSYAPDRAIANWGDGDQLIAGASVGEVAEEIAGLMSATGCDALNIRIQVKGLGAAQVDEQLERYANDFPALAAAASAF